MKLGTTDLSGVLIIQPKVFRDERGYFAETYNHERYKQFGITQKFVQDNLSFSERGVLRGLHYQHPMAQGKLVHVLSGCVFDVVVDIRKDSPTFRRWHGIELTSENKRQIYVPPNFAHGFIVTSETALIVYKCTEYYSPDTEGTIIWNDPEIAIDWPSDIIPRLSSKDQKGSCLADIESDLLPRFRK
jgi:dTDP-4-dehydrorhamnose 3,5-epimerase